MPAAIPIGTRLIHIGPAKTGTTSLQSAFHHNREAIAEHGVHYVGKGRQLWFAGLDAVRQSPNVARPTNGTWARTVEEVQASTADRLVLSSEFFAYADDFAVRAITDALGADRTHVVITFRPLADMLSSSWWQYVQSGARIPYDAWLDAILRTDPEGKKVTPSFWRRSRIDRLAKPWVDRVGAENVTVIALAERPRDFVLRVFEELTALPQGVLVPDEGESNSSLPFPIVETARHFNQVVRSQGKRRMEQVNNNRLLAYDLLKANRDLLTDNRKVETPRWAADRAGEIMGEINEGLRALGVNVVGDLDALTRPSRPAPEVVDPPPTEIPVGDAAALVYFMMRATEHRRAQELEVKFKKREQELLRRVETAADELGGRQLLRLLGGRVRRRITGR